jgi:hypothetical protein
MYLVCAQSMTASPVNVACLAVSAVVQSPAKQEVENSIKSTYLIPIA